MLEMLHGAGDESLFPRYSGVLQRLIENSTRRPNERLAGEIFFVAWLLTHEHQIGAAWALSRHGLGGVAIERAACALLLGPSEITERLDWMLCLRFHVGA